MSGTFAHAKRFGNRWSALTVLIGTLLLIIVFACADSISIAPPASSPTPLSSVSSSPARPKAIDASVTSTKLAALPIKGRAPKTGYDRSLFGPAWTDDVTVAGGHNGCDTRNDILQRDLVGVEIKPGSHGCTALAGALHDPYTGTTVEFHRGQNSSQVQIDHVVPLLDAWQKGAQQWDPLKRRNFANDPINLQATTASMNEQKRAGDAATWLPPNKSYRCTYVSRIVDVKVTYGLWVTQAEHDAITRIFTTCGAPTATIASPPESPPQTNTEYVPPPPRRPPGATALCRDGSYASSKNRTGTCSRHGGVAQWLPG